MVHSFTQSPFFYFLSFHNLDPIIYIIEFKFILNQCSLFAHLILQHFIGLY